MATGNHSGRTLAMLALSLLPAPLWASLPSDSGYPWATSVHKPAQEEATGQGPQDNRPILRGLLSCLHSLDLTQLAILVPFSTIMGLF